MDSTPPKKQTIGFTEYGHSKLKEISKRYRINQWMMVDVMIATVNEESPEFKEQVRKWQIVKGNNEVISPKVASSINALTSGMTEDEILALLERAKELNYKNL